MNLKKLVCTIVIAGSVNCAEKPTQIRMSLEQVATKRSEIQRDYLSKRKTDLTGHIPSSPGCSFADLMKLINNDTPPEYHSALNADWTCVERCAYYMPEPGKPTRTALSILLPCLGFTMGWPVVCGVCEPLTITSCSIATCLCCTAHCDLPLQRYCCTNATKNDLSKLARMASDREKNN